MSMWWTRSYKLVILRSGDQVPVINVAPVKYDPICHVFSRNLAKSKNVYTLLNQVKSLNDKSEPIKIEAEDKCEIMIQKENTLVNGFFDEFQSFEIPTIELLKLIEEWYQFLKFYEEGNIPYVIPPSKKEELVIVPRSEVKDDYWNN